MQATKRFFYGWVIVAAGGMVLAVGLGLFISTFSVFVIPVCDSLGFSRSQFTLNRTVLTLVSACAIPLYGKVVARIGIKKTLLIGAFTLAMVTFAYSFASELWHFYALAVVNGIFFNALNFMVIGMLINRWFSDQKGLATGLAFSGSGLGGAIMIPVISRAIEVAGWRFAYRLMGILGLAILLLVILLFIQEGPEAMGLKPYTANKTKKDDTNKTKGPVWNLTLGESLKTSRFWLLSAGFFLISAFAAATNTHSAPYFADIGYPTAAVSAIVSLLMVILTVGKILLGAVYDRFGTMTGNLVIAVCSLVFPVAALFAHIPAVPWMYAVSLGIASCGFSVPVSILTTQYFGTKDYPALFGVFTMITTLGPAISIPAMGAVYDRVGSYRPAWIALLVFSAIVTVCMVAAEATYRKSVHAKDAP